MLPAAVEYILALRDGAGQQVAGLSQHQIVVPNFQPLTTISYSIAPANPIQAYILYQFVFGRSMVCHSFDCKIKHGGSTLLNVLVSGCFTHEPQPTFAMIGHQQPALAITATNVRNLTNYFELTFYFVSIQTVDNYNFILDALRRMHTSTKSETLAKETNTILTSMPGVGPRQQIVGGR